MDWLSVIMEEYKSLREESLTAMQTQQSILRFGTATLGIVLAAGLNLWEKSLLPEFVFLFLIPLLSYLVIIIWVGEVERMIRAGTFLAQLEKKVNKAFGGKPEALTWESWLRTKQNRYLFSWDDVPGNDNVRLLKFLKDDLKIKWVENAEIEKSEDCITITKKNNSLIFKLNKEENKVILTDAKYKINFFIFKISGVGTHKYISKEEDSKLKIYEDSKTPQLHWNYRAILCIFSLIALASIGLGIYRVYETICFGYIVIISIAEVLLLSAVIFWYINKERYLKRQ
ncbi:hypothetical protein BEH94_01855 [Candidatus Altiarchaeales archaeon WOR_SM1_SCG]|nr:hypothetical protein BEH94_01855 [Candidatus Altiarchaeales archaeon WOR_SM1_SCG]